MGHGPGASAEAIQYHYDVANDFYELWLDETRTYSSALWEGTRDTLEAAQLRKLDYHIEQAHAHNTRRVLDIGCGWGSLLHRLAIRHGVEHVTGLTLSNSQARHIRRQNWPGVDVREESWWDHRPAEVYDAIISIGAFEHFARLDQDPADKIEGYRAFFERCHAWLKPGGYLSLQTMSYENSRRDDFSDYFKTEIFPESDLPRLSEIAQASEYRFEVVTLRADRDHYVRTVQTWRDRLKARRAQAVAVVGEATVAKYDKYLQLAMLGFHGATMNLLRIGFRRIDYPRGKR
jgi:cyclopropane-fatty-acyl-phospholipid synthase